MVAKQREIGERTSVVMEGRDIGTVVFPQADVKIFLDAQSGGAGAPAPAGTAAKGPDRSARSNWRPQMSERDQRDSTRADAPLAQAPDAVYLDSTGLGIEEVEEAILKIVRARVTNGKEYRLKDLLVMKFGGTSVGSAERMRVAARTGRRGSRRSGPWRSWYRRCRRSPTCCWTPCGTPRRATARGWSATWPRCAQRHEDACRDLLPAPRAGRGPGQTARRDRRIRAHRERHGDAGRAARRARWTKPWRSASGSRRCW